MFSFTKEWGTNPFKMSTALSAQGHSHYTSPWTKVYCWTSFTIFDWKRLPCGRSGQHRWRNTTFHFFFFRLVPYAWCIRLVHLNLVWEVTRYRLVHVRQSLSESWKSLLKAIADFHSVPQARKNFRKRPNLCTLYRCRKQPECSTTKPSKAGDCYTVTLL